MKIYTDSIHKMAYATDASTYREIPEGVAYPETEEDIAELIRIAHERHTCLIPRAGGTSIAGQVVGRGIVVDISRHFKRILEINAEERWVRVQPGVVRDELNIALKPYGLFFSPETSTSNRCCIGGMVGNNSCGTHSLVYGSTRHHVLALKGFLSDGSRFDTERPVRIRGTEPECLRSMESGELPGGAVGMGGGGSLEERIYAQLESWRDDPATRKLIEENYPDATLRRRSCGYAIDEAIDKPDLCKVITGSEGTLCFVTEIKLSLDPLPKGESMVLCAHCKSLEESFEANLVALKHGPVAIELMDGKILELGKDNPEARRNRFFVEGDPAALLIAEFRDSDDSTADQKADALEAELLKSGMAYACTRVYGKEVSRVWALRKAGLGVLSSMKGDAKPIGVIEDTAVAPQRLPAYMKDFREMLAGLGLSCVYYGHISTGELHLRPIINIKTEEGRKLFRAVAEETAKLVKKHRGSLSGEHGDGRLRGEFIPLMYGRECYELMRELKRCWDPEGVFNVGKIVDTPAMDEGLRFDVGQRYAIEAGDVVPGRSGRKGSVTAIDKCSELKTFFNWRSAFDECKVEGASGVRSNAHALMCSIEQCNGAGDCRKSNLIGGTLCPAFKVSADELMSTRARANVLRECLTRGDGFDAPELKEMLDSCLACKGCKGECPSNVDMTRIRAELLQQIYRRHGTPLRSWAVARMASVEWLGYLVRPLYNFFASNKISSSIIKSIIGFAPERSIPLLSKRTMRELVGSGSLGTSALRAPSRLAFGEPPAHEAAGGHGPETPTADQQHLGRPYAGNTSDSGRKKVLLFSDEFTNYQEAELGEKFAKLLVRLGYEVAIPDHVESGRAAISKGCLKLARKFAVKNVTKLESIVTEDCPLVGIEPSCILSFRDEYPDLVPPQMRDRARKLAGNCLLYDEFLLREFEAGRISPESFKEDEMEVWLHGHCHQKALVGVEKTAAVLRKLKGVKLNVIPSGCCGMAGSFGYEKEHYKMSLEIGEMVLFPAVRKAMATSAAQGNNADSQAKGQAVPAVIAAPGTSCRQQILDGTGYHAVHPIEILCTMLREYD